MSYARTNIFMQKKQNRLTTLIMQKNTAVFSIDSFANSSKKLEYQVSLG